MHLGVSACQFSLSTFIEVGACKRGLNFQDMLRVYLCGSEFVSLRGGPVMGFGVFVRCFLFLSRGVERRLAWTGVLGCFWHASFLSFGGGRRLAWTWVFGVFELPSFPVLGCWAAACLDVDFWCVCGLPFSHVPGCWAAACLEVGVGVFVGAFPVPALGCWAEACLDVSFE